MQSRQVAPRVAAQAVSSFAFHPVVNTTRAQFSRLFGLPAIDFQQKAYCIPQAFHRIESRREQEVVAPALDVDVSSTSGQHKFLGTWRNYLTGSEAASSQQPVGLYGYEQLKSPKGFESFAQDAIARSEDLIARVKELPPSMDTIRAMDDISDAVCTVVDAAELCRNTHPDKEFVSEANNASMRLYEYLQYLNTHPALYKAVLEADKSSSLITDEAQRAAKALRIDFERGGINLTTDKMRRVNELNLEITRLGREFGENVLKDPGQVDIFPSSKIPKGIRHMVQPIPYGGRGLGRVRQKLGDVKGSGRGVRVITEPGVLSAILKWVPDVEVRKQVYMVGHSVPKNNLRVIEHLIAARHELAQLLGYESYAEFAVAPSLAGSPESVTSFLCDLSTRIKHKADAELKMLEDFQQQFENGGYGTVNAWDELYYSGLIRAQTVNLDSRAVASYFPLAGCLEGIKLISESLFGATFREVAVDRGEAWHPDVRKLVYEHPDEGPLGYMYLDLYSRPGKFPSCAHFTLRGGRRLEDTKYQLPVVALVCNFSNTGGGGPFLLNHWEVETLFHEYGHALHSLLSRTEYQHFSGTRTVLDFSETPSHLLEYYAWDYRVLCKFAKHYSTGEVIPRKMVSAMNGARKLLAATEIQRQVYYAMIDQTFYGRQPLPASDTTAVLAEMKHKFTSWKHVQGTHWHTRFSHLVSYGAGYYSYLYARCLSASIWHRLCEAEPLSLETGEKLRRGFLEHGGAKDAAQMITNCLGPDVLTRSSCDSRGVKPCIEQLLCELDL